MKKKLVGIIAIVIIGILIGGYFLFYANPEKRIADNCIYTEILNKVKPESMTIQ